MKNDYVIMLYEAINKNLSSNYSFRHSLHKSYTFCASRNYVIICQVCQSAVCKRKLRFGVTDL